MVFLEFTFQSFWHFVGVVILMWVFGLIVAAARGSK